MDKHMTPSSCRLRQWTGRARGALALAALAITTLSLGLSARADSTEQRSQSAAQFPSIVLEGFKLQRKDFRFGDFKGWLKRGGEWHIEGPVRHRGLLCGTYEVGMRFGVGKPDCTDVHWVSADRYVSSQMQCNEAETPHVGTEIDTTLADHFDAITCAERIVRCSGNCK